MVLPRLGVFAAAAAPPLVIICICDAMSGADETLLLLNFKDNFGFSVNAKLDQQTITFLNELNKESAPKDKLFYDGNLTFKFNAKRSMTELKCNNGTDDQKNTLEGIYKLIE